MPLYRDGKGGRSGQNAPSLNTYYRALTENLSRMVIAYAYSKFEPQLDHGFQPQRAGAAKQHARVADILRPPLEPYRAVRFPVIDPQVQREASCTGWGFRCDSHGHRIGRETYSPFVPPAGYPSARRLSNRSIEPSDASSWILAFPATQMVMSKWVSGHSASV